MMMSKRKINPIERQERQAHPMRVLLLKRLTLLQAINSDVFFAVKTLVSTFFTESGVVMFIT